MCSTVGILEPSTGTTTSKLLRLASSRIGNKQRPVIPDENILNLFLLFFINEFLKIGNERFRDTLADCVDLRSVTSTFDEDPHVDSGKLVAHEEKDRLKRLVTEDLQLNQLDWDAIDLDKTTTGLAVSHSYSRLLLAKTLNRVRWTCRHVVTNPSFRATSEKKLRIAHRCIGDKLNIKKYLNPSEFKSNDVSICG